MTIPLRAWLRASILCVLIASPLASEDGSGRDVVTPLPRAHAHNDYEHERPLLDALSHGFTSVEADVFLIEGKLLVAHFRTQVRPGRTLEALYLDPLLERVRANGGSVYPGGPEFTLLVDLKNTGEKTYRALHLVLTRYKEMLTEVRNGKETRRAVRVILSGDRPRELLRAATLRYAGYDGRLEDLPTQVRATSRREAPENTLEPPHFLPLVSDRWTRHFRYPGKGEISQEERERLERIVDVAHRAGRRLRFWATPDTPEMWQVLLDAGVDHINTDDLPGLAKFLRERGEVYRPAKKVPGDAPVETPPSEEPEKGE